MIAQRALDLLRDAATGLLDWLARPRWLVGASLLRICLGFITFVFFALHIPERGLYWGPDGLVSFGNYWAWFGGMRRLGPNLYSITSDTVVFEVLFWVGLAVTLAFTLGLWTRIMTPAFALVVWSIYHRDPWITNGGTRLLCIVVIYLIIADLGTRFSLDEMLRRRREPLAEPRVPGAYRTMLHNTSVILIIFQLSIVYIFSTVYKLDGAAWQQGTGLYYALLDPQFDVSPLTAILRQSAFLVTVGTYATLLYQSAFPWLILHPQLKYPMILIGFFFHAGIALTMGLWWFSAVLIACEVVLLTDRQYAVVGAFLQALFRRPDPGRVPVLIPIIEGAS